MSQETADKCSVWWGCFCGKLEELSQDSSANLEKRDTLANGLESPSPLESRERTHEISPAISWTQNKTASLGDTKSDIDTHNTTVTNDSGHARAIDPGVFLDGADVVCPPPESFIDNPAFPEDPNALNPDGTLRYPVIIGLGRNTRPDFRTYPGRTEKLKVYKRWVKPPTPAVQMGRCYDCQCNPIDGLMASNRQTVQDSNYRCGITTPERCRAWFGCFCRWRFKQPEVDWEISHQDWRKALQQLPAEIKRQNPNFKFSIWYAQNPGDLGDFSMDINGGITFARPESHERYLVPGTKEPYYLEGPDEGWKERDLSAGWPFDFNTGGKLGFVRRDLQDNGNDDLAHPSDADAAVDRSIRDIGSLSLPIKTPSTSSLEAPTQVPLDTQSLGEEAGEGTEAVETTTNSALATSNEWRAWCPTYNWASRNLPADPLDPWWITGPQIGTADSGPVHRPNFTFGVSRTVLAGRYERYRAKCMGCACNPLTMFIEEDPLASSYEVERRCDSLEWAQRCAIWFRCFCRLNPPDEQTTATEKFPDLDRGDRERWQKYLNKDEIHETEKDYRGREREQTAAEVAKVAALASLQMSSMFFTTRGELIRSSGSTSPVAVDKTESVNPADLRIRPTFFHTPFRYECPPTGAVHSLMPHDPAQYKNFSSSPQTRPNFRNSTSHPSGLSRGTLNLYKRELSMCANCGCDPVTGAVVARIPSDLSGLQDLLDAPEAYPDQDRANRCADWYGCGCFARMRQPFKDSNIPLEEYKTALEQVSILLKGINPHYRWYYDLPNGEWISWDYRKGLDQEVQANFMNKSIRGRHQETEQGNSMKVYRREKFDLQGKALTLRPTDSQTENLTLIELGRQEKHRTRIPQQQQRNLNAPEGTGTATAFFNNKTLYRGAPAIFNSTSPMERAIESSLFGLFMMSCPTTRWIAVHLNNDDTRYQTFKTYPKKRGAVTYGPRGPGNGNSARIITICRTCECDQNSGSLTPSSDFVTIAMTDTGPQPSRGRKFCSDSDWTARCANWYRCSCVAVMRYPSRDPATPLMDYHRALMQLASTHRQRNPLYKWYYDEENGRYISWLGFGQDEDKWGGADEEELPEIDWEEIEGTHREMIGDRNIDRRPIGLPGDWRWREALDAAEMMAGGALALGRFLPHGRGNNRLLGPGGRPIGNGGAIQKREDKSGLREEATACAIEDWKAGRCIWEDTKTGQHGSGDGQLGKSSTSGDEDFEGDGW
ncbi:hypothetical protein TWF281_004420 [Arthrobotrys megalospora]